MASPLPAWGPAGHRWISDRAVDTLQGPLQSPFSRHRASLRRFSMHADYRKGEDPEEARRHFLNLDAYGAFPFPNFDPDLKRMVERWERETVLRNGTVLWAAAETFEQLVKALQRGDRERILREAADLSHYVGDLHQPLHLTRNYDGQLSGQRGLHARFESQLVDRYLNRIRYLPAPPPREEAVLLALHRASLETFRRVDDILLADRAILAQLGITPAQLQEPQTELPERYFEHLFERLGSILEERLSRAARCLAWLWETASRQADALR